MSFNRAEEVIAELRNTIARRVRPPEGALFSFVVRHTAKGSFVIGGLIRFSDEPLPARASIRHAKLALLEEWIMGADSALERIQAIFSGSGSVDSTEIPTKVTYTDIQESGRWYKSETGWKEWYFRSRLSHPENLGENELPIDPIVAPHVSPFVNGAHAMQEWIFKARDAWSSDRSSGTWELLTVLPDTRIRIARMEWSQAQLTLELEINVPEQSYDVQVLYGGSTKKRHDIILAKPGTLQFDIPDDAEAIFVFVVNDAGELLAQHTIRRPEGAIAAKKTDISEEERTRAELLAGESATVEFKPFVESKDQQKEAELVKTVVAFSNTNGGRLYVGVDDSGVPQGLAELKKATKRADDNVELSLKSSIDRLDQLFRNNVKPLPRYEIKVHDREGRPVVVVDVKKGDLPPYATFQNEYFVRHGSSSMRPDPSELRRLMRVDSAALSLWPLVEN